MIAEVPRARSTAGSYWERYDGVLGISENDETALSRRRSSKTKSIAAPANYNNLSRARRSRRTANEITSARDDGEQQQKAKLRPPSSPSSFAPANRVSNIAASNANNYQQTQNYEDVVPDREAGDSEAYWNRMAGTSFVEQQKDVNTGTSSRHGHKKLAVSSEEVQEQVDSATTSVAVANDNVEEISATLSLSGGKKNAAPVLLKASGGGASSVLPEQQERQVQSQIKQNPQIASLSGTNEKQETSMLLINEKAGTTGAPPVPTSIDDAVQSIVAACGVSVSEARQLLVQMMKGKSANVVVQDAASIDIVGADVVDEEVSSQQEDATSSSRMLLPLQQAASPTSAHHRLNVNSTAKRQEPATPKEAAQCVIEELLSPQQGIKSKSDSVSDGERGAGAVQGREVEINESDNATDHVAVSSTEIIETLQSNSKEPEPQDQELQEEQDEGKEPSSHVVTPGMPQGSKPLSRERDRATGHSGSEGIPLPEDPVSTSTSSPRPPLPQAGRGERRGKSSEVLVSPAKSRASSASLHLLSGKDKDHVDSTLSRRRVTIDSSVPSSNRKRITRKDPLPERGTSPSKKLSTTFELGKQETPGKNATREFEEKDFEDPENRQANEGQELANTTSTPLAQNRRSATSSQSGTSTRRSSSRQEAPEETNRSLFQKGGRERGSTTASGASQSPFKQLTIGTSPTFRTTMRSSARKSRLSSESPFKQESGGVAKRSSLNVRSSISSGVVPGVVMGVENDVQQTTATASSSSSNLASILQNFDQGTSSDANVHQNNDLLQENYNAEREAAAKAD
ncbi:unnamed protein product, partial [Amoebophrya sp. A25]|eukprot:GSA25T00022424001.1